MICVASIKKINGLWRVRYDAGHDGEGKRIQKYKGGFEKKGDVETYLTTVQNSINTGTYVEPDKMFVFQYLNQWLEDQKARLSPPTYSGYEVNIRCHINPFIGGVRIQELKVFHLKNLYSQLSKDRTATIDGEKKEFKKLSSTSILYVHRVLSSALEDAVDIELINKNPAKALKAPKKQKYKAKFLTVAQIKDMLVKFRDDEMYMPVYLAVVLGLRRGEVLGLRWKNVGFENKIVTICDEYTVADGKPIFIENVKTDDSDREIVVTDRIIGLLKLWQTEQKKNKILHGDKYVTKFLCRWSDGTEGSEIIEKELKTMDFVCTQPNGPLFNPSHTSRAFKCRMKKYDLPEIRFHDLRHSNGALMISANVPMKGASERLGHSTIVVTNDFYGHIEKSVQEQIAEEIDKKIWGE